MLVSSPIPPPLLGAETVADGGLSWHLLGRIYLPNDRLGTQKAQKLQEGIRQGVPAEQEGHVPLHSLASRITITPSAY